MNNPLPQRWLGDRLGLPEKGPNSMARMPRRIGAILIDWGSALLISHAFFKDDNGATLLVFGILQLAGIAAIGSSIGMLIAGIAVRSLRGRRLTPLDALVRTALLLLVIPVAIWDADSRGLHDKAAGTVLVRR